MTIDLHARDDAIVDTVMNRSDSHFASNLTASNVPDGSTTLTFSARTHTSSGEGPHQLQIRAAMSAIRCSTMSRCRRLRRSSIDANGRIIGAGGCSERSW